MITLTEHCSHHKAVHSILKAQQAVMARRAAKSAERRLDGKPGIEIMRILGKISDDLTYWKEAVMECADCIGRPTDEQA